VAKLQECSKKYRELENKCVHKRENTFVNETGKPKNSKKRKTKSKPEVKSVYGT
jgi:hypothetical protein